MACFSKASTLTFDQFWAAVWTERTRAAYLLTFGTSLVAAAVNVLLGLLVAWVLVRYRFPGRRLMDSLIDLPLALPTAVGGLVYASLYVKNGWLGQYLVPLGIQAAYSRLAIVLVLVFIGLPFVVRTVQPVLEDLDPEAEEAAASLGADALAVLPPRDPASAVSRAAHRVRAGLRALAGRVRVGRVRLREHALQDGDRARAHRGPPARSSPTARPPPSRWCCSPSRSRCSC